MYWEHYYQTVGFRDYEDGGMFIDDGDEDMMKKKGKYVKTNEHFHHLFSEEGDHPLPVVCHVRDYRMCGAEYTIELEDDEEFDIKKVQLVKSEYELAEEPYFKPL